MVARGKEQPLIELRGDGVDVTASELAGLREQAGGTGVSAEHLGEHGRTRIERHVARMEGGKCRAHASRRFRPAHRTDCVCGEYW